MLEILLACVVLALALSVYLLFRQLRKISWQLTLLRVEHDSEKILRAIGLPAEAAPTLPEAVRQQQSNPPGSVRASALAVRELIRAHRAAAAALCAAGLLAAVTMAATLLPRSADGANPSPPACTAPPASAAPSLYLLVPVNGVSGL